MIELVALCAWPLAVVLVTWLVMRSFETGAMAKLAERLDTLEGDAKLQESRVLELQKMIIEDLETMAKSRAEPAPTVNPSWLEEMQGRVERLETHTSNLTVANAALGERVQAVDEDCNQVATDLEGLSEKLGQA